MSESDRLMHEAETLCEIATINGAVGLPETRDVQVDRAAHALRRRWRLIVSRRPRGRAP